MNPVTVRGWLLCVLVAVLVVAAAPFAWYAPTIARATKSASIHTDGLVGEARLAAKNSVIASKDTDVAMKNLNLLVLKFGVTADAMTGTIQKVGNVADAAAGTVSQAGTLVAHINDDVTKAEKPAAETKAKIDKAIDAYETLPSHLNGTLDASTATIDSINRFVVDPKTGELRDSLNVAIGNTGLLAGNFATLTKHFDNKYFPQWDGTHPFRHHAAEVGRFAVGMVQPLAGGIALAKGN